MRLPDGPMIHSMNMPEADEIARSRPPDRSVEGMWEDDPESEYEIVEHVPVEGSLLRGFTYREVRHEECKRERRRVTEFWDEPAHAHPRQEFDARDWDGTLHDIIFERVPARTVGRWRYEYRPQR
jgi:hypothetical protein